MSNGEQANRIDGETTGGVFLGSEQFAELKAVDDPAASTLAWLEILARILPGLRQGLVVFAQPGRTFQPAAVWPHRSVPGRRLIAATDAVVRGGRLVVETAPLAKGSDEVGAVVLGYPLSVGQRLRGVVTVELTQDDSLNLPLAIDQLAWASGWLESVVRRRGSASDGQLATAVEILAGALHHHGFREAATAAATELASTLSCERVSIGFLKGRHVRLMALSNSANFGKKANLVRALEAAMDEAVDQKAALAWPPIGGDDGDVVRLHQTLYRENGGSPSLTVPLSEDQRPLGALTLEWPQDKPIDPAVVKLVEEVAALLGPVLEVKRRDDRWLGAKAADSAGDLLKRLFGPRHVGLKLGALALATLVVFFAVVKGDYRVTANASLEGAVQRAVAAPIAGYIAEANVRAGDIVREGQVLALLDERDLRLERLKWVSQKAKQEREYSEALSRHERAKTLILQSQIDQADAQLALVDDQLARLRIVAPFDGYVVAGDLSQALGAPVERGNVLFEIAPLDDYRVVLKADERDVSALAPGQTGELALNAEPDVSYRFRVDKVTPISTAEEGLNYFRVEASLEDQPPPTLRPGMQGIGKVMIDRRRLAWIWTHRITHWARVTAWSWWP